MTRRLGSIAVLLIVIVALLWALWPRDRVTGEAPPALGSAQTDEIARGRDLVLLADCEGCHTARGGGRFAGSRAIPTPFGLFFSPNITQDTETGIGRWTAQDFWHALHDGYAPGRRLLYPTFPYTNYTKISRRDADAMFAFLKTIPAVHSPDRRHELRFPYSQRWLLAVWRGLFFRPGVYRSDSHHDADWNRGAYLVQGVAHCSACHEARNALGAIQSEDNPAGGLVLSWYAPALTSSREAGVQTWDDTEVIDLLKSGVVHGAHGQKASVFGPMAEVVYGSLQNVDEHELRAIAAYLKSLPDTQQSSDDPSPAVPSSQIPLMMSQGQQLYADNCAACHGDAGEGRWPAAPALAGNRVVSMGSALNSIRMVLYGGFGPGTESRPRPFGMPPFYTNMTSEEMASVLTYIRGAWGNGARPVSADEVESNKTGPLW